MGWALYFPAKSYHQCRIILRKRVIECENVLSNAKRVIQWEKHAIKCEKRVNCYPLLQTCYIQHLKQVNLILVYPRISQQPQSCIKYTSQET